MPCPQATLPGVFFLSFFIPKAARMQYPLGKRGLSLVHVALLAVTIRCAHLAVLIAIDQLLEDYDSSVHLHSHHDTSRRNPKPANLLDQLFSSLLVWDSVFFAEISRHGYEYEQYYAFFPLLPSLASLLGPTLIPIMAHAVSLACSVLTAVLFAKLSSHVLQQPSTAATATLLLLLGQACLFHTVAYTESLFSALTMAGLCCLYCTGQPASDPNIPNPATATPPARPPPSSSSQSGPRSHSSSSSRVGKQEAGCKPSTSRPVLTPISLLAACVAFTLASCARSNGIINCGYIAHASLGASISHWQQGSRAAAAAQLAMGAAAAATVTLPVVGFQLQGYLAFCCPELHGCRPAPPGVLGSVAGLLHPLRSWATGGGLCGPACSGGPWHELQGTAGAAQHGSAADAAVSGGVGNMHKDVDLASIHPACSSTPGECEASSPSTGLPPPRPWCSRRSPSIYSFVQEHYWGVGLLRYWRLHQLPNFLLAAPALLAAAAGCRAYSARNLRLLLQGGWPHLSPALSPPHERGFLSPAVAVHIYPWAFMAAYALLLMHVQVATRFLSCCPAQYWFLATLTSSRAAGAPGPDESCAIQPDRSLAAAGPSSVAGSLRAGAAREQPVQRPRGQFWKLAVWGCCLGYTVVGSVMFPNFYPWT